MLYRLEMAIAVNRGDSVVNLVGQKLVVSYTRAQTLFPLGST